MTAEKELRDVSVLVTGGAGFIGSHLVDALLARGARVRVLDNFYSGRRENLAGVASRIELVEGDMRDVALCQRVMQGVDYVFHQAAVGSVPRSIEDPVNTLSANVGGTANIFTAARDAKVRRVVYASSSSVYGDSTALPKREGEEGRPLSPYAVSKVMSEELAAVFGRCYGMEFVGLRYFNVFGPRQDPKGAYAAVIPRFFASTAVGERPVIYGDGEQSRDFTFVADVVRANLLATTVAPAFCGRAYNIGAGGGCTVNELLRGICDLTGKPFDPDYRPEREGDVRHSKADTTAYAEASGFRAQVSLADGLLQTKPDFAA